MKLLQNKNNTKILTVGVDLMGSDQAPSFLLQTVVDFLSDQKLKAHFIVLGTKELKKYVNKNIPSLSFLEVKNFISMEESPLLAIRRKKDSSLCTGIRLLKENKIDAFVSAGNTGALLASAKMFLSPLPSITRPALLALMPTQKKPIAVLDVGANVSCRATHLLQFALLGIAFQKNRNILCPKVGILNIGSEAKKGTAEIQKVYHILQEISSKNATFSFLGNIEGKEVFRGDVDVLVTDGFTGNVFLKTAEGVAQFLLDQMLSHFPQEQNSFLSKDLRFEEYSGALLCGVDGIVIKCHSDSSQKAFLSGIQRAFLLSQTHFLDSFKEILSICSKDF